MNNNKNRKQNNSGFTLVEMVVTFALLGIFMVAAARVITYTVNIYYVAKGNSYGYEVSYMIANKVKGQLENAGISNSFKLTEDGDPKSTPVVLDDGKSVKFVDGTGSVVTILTENNYLVIRYDAVGREGDPDYYKEVDWKFDEAAYMGYTIADLRFVDPGTDYPNNVLKLEMTVHSPKYGDFTTQFFIKCYNIESVEYING